MTRGFRWVMVCCVTLEWIALAVWVGGMIVLSAVVIPAVFNTFGGQDSGGMFLTRVFEGYQRFTMGAAAILGGGVWYRWWSGDPIVNVGRGELIILASMVVIGALIIVVLHPQAAALQAQAFATKDEAAKKAALEALFRILLPTRSLYMVNLVLGVVLISLRAKQSLGQNGMSS